MERLRTGIFNLLKRSERYTKTDMVYLAKGSFWMTIGQGVAVISAFILSVIFAHFVPKEIYGDYKFILSIAGIIGGLSLTGIGTTLTQAVARGAEGTFYIAVRTQIIWSSIVGIGCLITALYYFINENNSIGFSLIIAAITLPLTNAASLYSSYLSGKKDFRRSTLYWSAGQLINIAVLALIAIAFDSVVYLIIGYFVTNLITNTFFYKRTLSLYSPSIDTADHSMIRYGKHISIMNFIGTIANQLDKVLVYHYVGAAPLAVYSFAFAIPEQIKGTLKNLFNIAVPKFAELDEARLRKSIVDKVLRLTLVCIVIVIGYYFIAPYIYSFFFPKYLDSIRYSQLYMLGLITFPGISLFSLYFQLIKDTRTLYTLTIIGNVVTIIFSIVLISRFGTIGAVMENTASWTVMLMVNLFLFLKRKPKNQSPSPTPATTATVS